MALAWRLGTVAEVRSETPTARTLLLDVPGWEGHVAGQHVDVRLTAEDGYQTERSYSIASPPEEPRLALSVERLPDGEVSPYLTDELQPGDELEFRGPIGGWFAWRVDDGGPLLLIAGGSGLVPLMAMLRHRAAHERQLDVRLLVSVRSLTDLFYRDELAALTRRGAAATSITVTRTPPPGWDGLTGRVDAAMLAAIGPAPGRQPRIFVCGPSGFVETVANLLVDAGHEAGAIRVERFGPTGS